MEEIFGGVDGHVVAAGHHGHADSQAVFEPTKLFERFSLLKSAQWQGTHSTKHIGLIGINANMLVIIRLLNLL